MALNKRTAKIINPSEYSPIKKIMAQADKRR